MLQLAAVKVVVTPDRRGMVGLFPAEKGEAEAPRDDLFARLFLLDDGAERLLIASLDYGGIFLSTQETWRKRLAAEVGIAPDRVMLHCVHQHDAPFLNPEAARLAAPGCDWSWLEPVLARLEAAAAHLPGALRPVGRLGWSECRLHGYASNRRVPMADGSIATRSSRCAEAAVRHRPVGLIDPMLRTLGFYAEDGGLLASWSFYATHPQVANTGRRFSADAPGEAMRLLEERRPGALHSFFNGCFGDISAGKYTVPDDPEGNLRYFGKLLADGIGRNLAAPEFFPVGNLTWTGESFPFPAHVFSEEELAERARGSRLVAAALRAGQEWAAEHPEVFTLNLLTLGEAKILFCGGELFIAYQLFCQSLIPDEKLAFCGNCGDDFFYLGTEQALRDRTGYEIGTFCRVEPEFEALFQAAAHRLLRPGRSH